MTRQHDLAQLIDEVKAATGWSDEDIAHRARQRRLPISKQHIANLRAQNPLKSLVPSTLEAVAAGLEVPLRRVVEAALSAAGLPTGPPQDWSIEAAIEADPDLPVAAKRLLLQSVAVARGDGHGRSRVGVPTPKNPGRPDLGKPNPAGRAARKRQPR